MKNQKQFIARTALRLAAVAVPMMAVTFAAACGSHESTAPYVGANPTKSGDPKTGDATADGSSKRDKAVKPPREYYDALFAQALLKIDASKDDTGLSLADPTATQVLYLNFEGANINKGFNAGQSFVLCAASAAIDAPKLTAKDRQAIVDQVQKYFEGANAQLMVTADAPTAGDFTTMIVGGSFADLGCSGKGVLGIAPLDEGNANKNDIGFAFTDGVTDVKVVAETIAHEAGHTFGLQHSVDSTDLMYAAESDAISGFKKAKIQGSALEQDAPTILQSELGTADGSAVAAAAVSAAGGAGSAIAAIPGLSNLPAYLSALPGLNQIAMIAQLVSTLKTTDVASIEALIPQILALFPNQAKNVNIQGLDKVLTAVGIAVSAASKQSGQAAPTTLKGLLNPALLGSVLTSPNGQAVTSLATLAGFGNVGTAVSAISTIFGAFSGQAAAGAGSTTGTGSAVAAVTPPVALPDFAALLGLVLADKTIPALIKSLLGSAEVIVKNYTGAEKDALLSLVKVAYSQLYDELAKQQAAAATP